MALRVKDLDVYVPPLPHFPDVESAKIAEEKENSPVGINHWHTTALMLLQTAMLIAWALLVEADARKEPVPDPGLLENPDRIDYVQPFKRYPPGHDIFAGSERMDEFKIQEHYSSFVQITMFTFLALPWSFSFLKRYAYSAVGFAIVSASITTQFGVISMQVVDFVHCGYLKTLLARPDFDRSRVPDRPCPEILGSLTDSANASKVSCSNNYVYTCRWTTPLHKWDAPPLDEINDDFGNRQLRQACYCDLYDRMTKNKTLALMQPKMAHQAFMVTGRTSLDPNKFALSFMTMIDGIYATVPVLISFGVVLGKMTPIQLVPFGMLNVMGYAWNLWVCTYVIGAWDHTGGACVNHIFGACFGIAATASSYVKGSIDHNECSSRYHIDIMALIGTLIVWTTYPTYNSFYAPPFAQQAVAVNTYLAVLSSAVSAMIFSALFHPRFKLTITDAQRSAIAGGVAMSSNANLMCDPWMALVIGGLGGMACCFGIHRARGFFQLRLQVHDTVGVTSMHLWPGLIAWIFGVITFLPLNNDVMRGDQQSKNLKYKLEFDKILNHNRGTGDAVLAQIYIAPMSIANGLVTGLLAGMVAKKIKKVKAHEMYLDSTFYAVPDDFHETKADKSEEPEDDIFV